MINIQENDLALITGGISETGAKVLGGVVGFILGFVVSIPVCIITGGVFRAKVLPYTAFCTCTSGFTVAGVNIAKNLWKESQKSEIING